MPRVKIVGNMTAWNNPTEISAHIASDPVAKVATSITAKAAMAAPARMVSAERPCIR